MIWSDFSNSTARPRERGASELRQATRGTYGPTHGGCYGKGDRYMTGAVRESRPTMQAEALWYAENGIPVFPLPSATGGRCSCGKPRCSNPGKHPRTEHGFKNATTDPHQIGAWWQKWPEANIGMPTGAASGLLAVDVDPRNGGDSSLDELQAKHGQLPKTAEQITGGGGRHIVYRHRGGSVPKNLAHGIDLKGDGGYIVLAPSIHASGNRYQWDGVDGAKAILDPAEPPRWLVEYITAARSDGRAEGKTAAGDKWRVGERNDKLTG